VLSPTNDIHIYKALRPSRSLKMLMVQVGNTKSATGLLKVLTGSMLYEEANGRRVGGDTTTNNHLHLQLQRL